MSTKEPENLEKKFWNNVIGFSVAILLALGIRSFVFEPFNIPSGSMIPSLLIGDYIVVSKPTYGYSRYSFPFGSKFNYFEGRIWGDEPQTGQVAVFRPTYRDDTDFIKRVIGTPGDKIQMKKGVLFINDIECKLEEIEDYEAVNDDGRVIKAKQYIETLPNGVQHRIIKQKPFGEGHYDNTPIYTVPEGHFFMVGDNRDGSDDSRGQGVVGFIPYENFIGEAQFIFFSTGGKIAIWEIWKWPLVAHYNRMFMGIH